ncbi:MAG: alanine--tRNA ligase [Actinomycetota bacterium]|nr:alanine--tRNA ligase [Actinomycetota bacterium]
MTSDEIRRTFLEFFQERDHKLLPSASLIPSDPSVMFTIAGMLPLKPYFLGAESPPYPRATTCQKVFRTVDIELIGTTSRHLTFFEMLGNFSFGDYFKREAARFAWDLSVDGFGLPANDIWVTVFAGDEELGLGPDEEAIGVWLEIGVPRERIIECPRSENFWQMGPTGPCGPDSELYLDRGVGRGKPDDLPGEENERFLEFWNLVFMQYDLAESGRLTPLPARNIDTGLGLNRFAAMLQDKPSVFETDQIAPLIELGEELSGRAYGAELATDRTLRILADHSRSMTFLVADGVVPSNEERGYVLRRIMRRAILQGRKLELDPGFLTRYSERVTELMSSAYPGLHEQREAVHKWLAAEEEGFGRTLEQGVKLLDELVARSVESGAEGISAQDAFMLHDTFGFPIDLTLEIVAEHDLGVDEEGFEALMREQRDRSRPDPRAGLVGGLREPALALAAQAGFRTEFVGYETTDRDTSVGALASEDGTLLVKLVESPFYPTGGGQVADCGFVECKDGDCLALVREVLRLGDDQVMAVELERGELRPGERVHAHVDRAARHATECNHTATHLLHAALRRRLGTHVRQAGSYVGPDKLRFDFTHASALTPEEVREIEDQVNAWMLEAQPVRALTTTLEEARRLGAMALFGEKYGDVVRVVEVGDGSFSRELCGGTHVRNTAEIGLLKVERETSSAANVRRIEALTGPEAVKLARGRDRLLAAAAQELRVPPERVPDAVAELRGRVRELERAPRRDREADGTDVDRLLEGVFEREGARVLTAVVVVPNVNALLDVADRLRNRLGDAVIVLGAAGDERVDLVASVAPSLVDRGVRANEIVKVAAAAVGGGGGGRETLARAGGREPDKLPAAITAARDFVEAALAGSR